MTGSYRNLQNALPSELSKLNTYGKVRLSRNGSMREVIGHTIQLERPWERFQTLTGRNANPVAQLAETLWVLAGRNDVDWLKYYLPRAEEFSDDGRTWRAGYGPRLRKYGRRKVDQVAEVLKLLRADHTTRRAVCSLWDPSADYASSKDIPCNNWIQFLIRDGALYMHIAVRSNDIMWGWSGINTFEWSFLQEVLAHTLGLNVGSATYFIGSFHLYEHHWERAKKITDARQREREFQVYDGLVLTPNLHLTLPELDGWLQTGTFFQQEAQLRTSSEALRSMVAAEDTSAQADITRMLDVYARVRAEDLPAAIIDARANMIARKDMRVATLEWLSRQAPETPTLATNTSDIWDLVSRLQVAKGRTYGDSWRKYGERGSIFPNIARKYDRLENINEKGAEPSPSETLLDTIVDLGVYATLYYGYLKRTDFDAALISVRAVTNVAPHDGDSWATIKSTFRYIAVWLGMLPLPDSTDTLGQYTSLESAVLMLATACFTWASVFRTFPAWNKFAADVDAFCAPQETAV